MKFCNRCRIMLENGNFCNRCGGALVDASPSATGSFGYGGSSFGAPAKPPVKENSWFKKAASLDDLSSPPPVKEVVPPAPVVKPVADAPVTYAEVKPAAPVKADASVDDGLSWLDKPLFTE